MPEADHAPVPGWTPPTARERLERATRPVAVEIPHQLLGLLAQGIGAGLRGVDAIPQLRPVREVVHDDADGRDRADEDREQPRGRNPTLHP